MIQKILTCARGSKSSALTIKMAKDDRSGDCVCRGLYSEHCGITSFCCGACRNSRYGGRAAGASRHDPKDVEAQMSMNSCTGAVGKWGAAAGTICGVTVLAIVVGAQL